MLTRRLIITTAVAAGAAVVATTTTATAAVPSSSQLKHALIAKSDLPAGWKTISTPTPKPSEGGAIPTTLAKCLGVSRTAITPKALALTVFNQGSSTIDSNASSFASKTAAHKAVSLVRSSKFASCTEAFARKQLASSLPSGGTIKNLTVTAGKPYAGAASSVIATVTTTMTVSFDGQDSTVQSEGVFIAHGLVLASVEDSSAGGTVDTTLLDKLGNVLAGRVNKL